MQMKLTRNSSWLWSQGPTSPTRIQTPSAPRLAQPLKEGAPPWISPGSQVAETLSLRHQSGPKPNAPLVYA